MCGAKHRCTQQFQASSPGAIPRNQPLPWQIARGKLTAIVEAAEQLRAEIG
jgi:hypothetical protein